MERSELPLSFLDEMGRLLGAELPDYLASFSCPWVHGLRVNTRKLSAEQFCSLAVSPLEPIPWIANGFYYNPDWAAAKDPYHYAGLYYLQEPSAMTPASFLPVKPGDTVLDLCGAPGGKSTELGARLKGQGLLFANDISNSRAKALLKNLERFGIPNICVASESPDRLSKALPAFFDQILVDAPCSGEGMFRKEPAMIREWDNRGPKFYAPIQQNILHHAVKLLKPGGNLLYSTCTFSRLENEANVSHLLETCPEMELRPLPLFPGAADGVGLSGVIRLYPHRIRGEGHFLALLHKKERDKTNQNEKRCEKNGKKEEDWRSFSDFQKQTAVFFAPDRIRQLDNRLYYLPENFPAKARLRYLRTGLFLGELKSEHFQPSQALAMALTSDQFTSALQLSHKDDRVFRYLKGETLALAEGENGQDGWRLVCVDKFPLGWAKEMKRTLKNKYYPGWRCQ